MIILNLILTTTSINQNFFSIDVIFVVDQEDRAGIALGVVERLALAVGQLQIRDDDRLRRLFRGCVCVGGVVDDDWSASVVVVLDSSRRFVRTLLLLWL